MRNLPCALFLLFLFSSGSSYAASPGMPIPPSELAIPAALAAPWVQVAPTNDILEGAIFDPDGNLLFCDVTNRRVLRLGSDQRLSTVLQLENLSPGGLAFDKDGRLFIAALDLRTKRGGIFALAPNSSSLETILPDDAGFWPNDLVMAPGGGLYFSDFHGSATNPAGGVYYLPPDFSKPVPVIPHMGQANGVALSPDGKTLWATEFAKNRLHRATLADPVTVGITDSTIPCHFTGGAPDSMRVDRDGNVYVAMYGQGRILIFNDLGIPIGQILLPGREHRENLLNTSLAINPAANELFTVSSNLQPGRPAMIFRADALAPGQPPANQH